MEFPREGCRTQELYLGMEEVVPVILQLALFTHCMEKKQS